MEKATLYPSLAIGVSKGGSAEKDGVNTERWRKDQERKLECGTVS